MPFHLRQNPKPLARLTRFIQGALLVLLALSLFASLRTGLADNGDFSRVMTWFTSGPANMAENPPVNGTPEYHQRFFAYFIPEWKLDFPLNGMFSSVTLLWLPGVLLNWLFYSHSVLSMTMVGLVPRLLSLVILWLAFRWINHSYPVETGGAWQALILTLTLGIPLTWMLGSGAYAVYFNSFYQETGSFIFLFLFLASLIYAWQKEALWPRFLALAALLGLLTAKTSNIYWAVPGVLLVVPWRKVQARPKDFIPLYIGIAATLALAVILIPSQPNLSEPEAFQSLFNGALTFSKDPVQRLDELGLKGANKCIYQSAFLQKGIACSEQFGEKISFLSTTQVILHEPLILSRIARFAAQNMQGLTLELGKSARGADQLTGLQRALTEIWASLKERIFPRSLSLLAALAIFTAVFAVSLKGWAVNPSEPPDAPPFRRQLALVGLLATLACFVDMNVQVLGDGRADITKHLFMANVLFDVAAIAALNVGVMVLFFDRTRFYRIFRIKN